MCRQKISQLHKMSLTRIISRLDIKGNNLVIYGDGNSTRDYIYVDDICLGIEKCIEYSLRGNKNNNFEKFHLANNQEISLNHLSQLIISKTSSTSKVIFKEKRKGEVIRNFADITKAKIGLNFETQVSLDYGLDNTIKWLSKYCS